MSDEKYIVKGYFPTIGIECHVQLKTASKLFGTAGNDARDAAPNTLVDQVCFGLPGTLPVLNKEAVRLASKAAFALGTKPQTFSKFDRKHYFYPDLPKGYQISQFDEPIIAGGSIDIVLEDGNTKTVNITRAHMEEDAGKSTHPVGADYSLVDLNRVGTPLLEIVSEPELHSPAEAKAYAKELWLRMKYAGVSDVNLYHGNMRFDVNVSVSTNPKQLGTRSETKNLNSFRSVERAVEYEINRQIKLLEDGGEVMQETRGWLDGEQKTVSQRSKEDSHDYRYFPDPDLPPIVLDESYISEIEKEIPPMPNELRKKLGEKGIDEQSIETLLQADVEFDAQLLDVLLGVNEKTAKAYTKWIVNIEIPMHRSAQEPLYVDPALRETLFSSVAQLVADGKLNSNNAKTLIEELITTDALPESIEQYAEKAGYIQVSDEGELQTIVATVLEANPKAVEDVKNGEMKAIGFLVGQIMKESKGTANPALVQRIIRKQLDV